MTQFIAKPCENRVFEEKFELWKDNDDFIFNSFLTKSFLKFEFNQ